MARPPAAAGRVILALETSCDETAAALVTHDGEIRANVVASQADLHAQFGGVVPEIASRRHLELVLPVVRQALSDAGATLDDVDLVAVTRGPGPDRRAARRRLRGEGARLVASAAARTGRPSRRSRRVAVPGAGVARSAVPLPARERRAHDAARRPGARLLRGARDGRSTTPSGKPSTRAPGCSGWATPAAPSSTASRATATRRRSRSRSRSSRASTSPSPGSRPRSSTR